MPRIKIEIEPLRAVGHDARAHRFAHAAARDAFCAANIELLREMGHARKIFGGGEQVAEARRRKAELLDARSAGERTFVASNVLNSAAVLEREAVGKD